MTQTPFTTLIQNALKKKKTSLSFAEFYSSLSVTDDISSDELSEGFAQMARANISFDHTYGAKTSPEDMQQMEAFHEELQQAGIFSDTPNSAKNQSPADLLKWSSTIAKDFFGNGISADDLLQDASVGLMEAHAYNQKHPQKDFEKFARLWCQWMILKHFSLEPNWVLFPKEDMQQVQAFAEERAKEGKWLPSITDLQSYLTTEEKIQPTETKKKHSCSCGHHHNHH